MSTPVWVRTAAAAAATAALGARATDVTSRWCRTLDQPRWQPPDAVLGPVWTALRTLIAISSARALARAHAAVLEASTLDLLRRTWRLDTAAGAMLVPYALWNGSVTVLSARIAAKDDAG